MSDLHKPRALGNERGEKRSGIELARLAVCFVIDVFPANTKCSRVASLGKMLQLRYGRGGKIESTASGITVSTKEVEASLNPTRLAFPSFP